MNTELLVLLAPVWVVSLWLLWKLIIGAVRIALAGWRALRHDRAEVSALYARYRSGGHWPPKALTSAIEYVDYYRQHPRAEAVTKRSKDGKTSRSWARMSPPTLVIFRNGASCTARLGDPADSRGGENFGPFDPGLVTDRDLIKFARDLYEIDESIPAVVRPQG